MDAKVTLSFNKDVIARAKKFAETQNLSLSRLLEYLLDNITSRNYASLEELPIADWISKVAEGEAEYVRKPRTSRARKAEFRKRKK